MTREGVDFATQRPGGAAIAAAGRSFVVRYVPWQGDGGHGLTADELADYHGHGLGVALVFESATHRASQGMGAGMADAAVALRALRALGFPGDRPVYFAVDWDATDADMAAIDSYLGGAASVLGAPRIGVYGGLRVIRHVKSSGTARWLWQTYAWSAGVLEPGVHLYQYANGRTINGIQVDYDRGYGADFGAWEAEMAITISRRKGEDWLPTTGAGGVSNGVLRLTPDATAAIASRVPVGTVVRSIAEIKTSAAADFDWRLTSSPDGTPLYMLRRDWSPLVPGGDPSVDKALADYIARDTTAELVAAYNDGVAAAIAAAQSVKR